MYEDKGTSVLFSQVAKQYWAVSSQQDAISAFKFIKGSLSPWSLFIKVTCCWFSVCVSWSCRLQTCKSSCHCCASIQHPGDQDVWPIPLPWAPSCPGSMFHVLLSLTLVYNLGVYSIPGTLAFYAGWWGICVVYVRVRNFRCRCRCLCLCICVCACILDTLTTQHHSTKKEVESSCGQDNGHRTPGW